MEAEELQSGHSCLHSFPKLPLLIIEYAWAHKMMDVQQVVDLSSWPDMASQPLSLEDSWRFRVASAQVLSIVKNRSMEHMERAMGFLDTTHRLLPTLVAPIKHMKIMFGLKTMLVMWMLKEGHGMVETVFKINQFFPNKLPQYQDQCSQREMLLMRKNHVDFKALAQTLAMDKDKLEDFIMNQMEEQYGEHYAQKVEDRLLHYLQELETVLPGDTYIDKILKKESPETEAERLLLEVITSDSTTIATTLKKLLHCDVASCRLGRVSETWKSDRGNNGINNPQLSMSVLYGSSSKTVLMSVEAKTPRELEPEVFRGGVTADQDMSEVSPLLLESAGDSDVQRAQRTEEGHGVVGRVEGQSSDTRREGNEGVQEAASSPQFCSKHQRWVKTILQECPDEGSEELLLHTTAPASSPLLFHSSSSTSSSQDLTPSDLIPCPTGHQHPPSQTSTHPQTAAQAAEQAGLKSELRRGSPVSGTQPSPPGDTGRPSLLNPVVHLIDMASIRGLDPASKLRQARPNHLAMSSHKQAASSSSPYGHTSGNDAVTRGTMTQAKFNQAQTPNTTPTKPRCTTHEPQTSSGSEGARSWTGSPQAPPRLCSTLRRPCSATARTHGSTMSHQSPPAGPLRAGGATSRTTRPLLPDDVSVCRPPARDASSSAAPLGIVSSVCRRAFIPSPAAPSPQVAPRSLTRAHPQARASGLPLATPHCSTAASAASRSHWLAVTSQSPLRLSLPCQAVLLQSSLLQPCVSLPRVSAAECHTLTNGRSSARSVEPVVQDSSEDRREEGEEEQEEEEEEGEENADSSFDVNMLYSSHSSNSGEDTLDCDPEYKPCIKKKRLLLEYEAARILNHI